VNDQTLILDVAGASLLLLALHDGLMSLLDRDLVPGGDGALVGPVGTPGAETRSIL
jgi:hypothetical protein